MAKAKKKGTSGKAGNKRVLKAVTEKAVKESLPPEMVEVPEKKLEKIQKLNELLIAARIKNSRFSEQVVTKQIEFLNAIKDANDKVQKMAALVSNDLVGEEAIELYDWTFSLELGTLTRGAAKPIPDKKARKEAKAEKTEETEEETEE